MEVNYIFIKKPTRTDNNSANTPFYQQLLLPLAKKNTLTQDSFILDFNNKEYTINYTCSRLRRSRYQVKIIINQSKNLDTARVLNYLCDKLNKSNIHHRFYINKTYDESSEYLCDKAYAKFSRFERKIRQLIYFILIKTYGINWVEKTVDNNLYASLRQTLSDDKIIEQGLQEMNIYQLESFLFEKRYWCDIDDILTNQLSLDNVNNMEKEQIIYILQKLKKESLWGQMLY